MRSEEDWTAETYSLAEKALGYTFQNKELLKTAFTHTSFSNLSGGKNNERLELLGDAVLQLVVTEKLFKRSGASEGELTELRKQYVSRPALEEVEKKLALMPYLRYAGSLQNIGGKTPSNLVEAVVAAIYLDGGMEKARQFIEQNLCEAQSDNYKSALQELVQEREKVTPAYDTREEGGAFVCRVQALGCLATGRGSSKKAAETDAAKTLYFLLKKGD